ncbi:hypothetical protein P9B03_03825 [Metasolibacillus meyeri]|uniref:Uncharacterized protein n=1 Tax=Metasolibacillus meyeri TaxID=1071052 RepID=A0AAW9NIK0_9BACL|nr:hypothetical protein [Metasolibacillus meyeri]MEC1177602.1 hypothetical protein [Metasolibacillus meyeri]
MKHTYLLQNRINELDSAILNFVGNKVHITGFYNAQRLEAYLNEGKDNHKSKGLYNRENITFTSVKDNSLFVVQENGIEQYRVQYQRIFKETLKLKISNTQEMVSIHKDIYSNRFVHKTEKSITSFENRNELNNFLLDKYQTELTL